MGVSISDIIVRTDNQELAKKATEVNKFLSEFCKEMNFYFVDTYQYIYQIIYIPDYYQLIV